MITHRLRLETAGESHGPALVGILSGLPAGVPVDPGAIAAALAGRRNAPGRSARQKREADAAEILAGVRRGKTTGAPFALLLPNACRDPHPSMEGAVPRPGHADLAGILKFDAGSIGEIAERASARRTALDAAFGAVLRGMLAHFGAAFAARVLAVGGEATATGIKAALKRAAESGETLGGFLESEIAGLPPGLGSPFDDRFRADAALAGAMLALPAVRGLFLGDAPLQADLPGSAAHDALVRRPGGRIVRASNLAGGIEGGVTNGEPVRFTLVVKPLPSAPGARSVDLATGMPAAAPSPRHDVSAVHALAPVALGRAALVFADLLLLKFGGDTLAETLRAHAAYMKGANKRLGKW